MLSKVKNNKVLKIILGILLLPIILNTFSLIISVILNFGRFVGTYLATFIA